MTRLPLLAVPFLVFLLLAQSVGLSYGQEFGTIAAVNLTPDNKRVIIKTDGQVGTHSAFVIERPCRLVIDFESTGLGAVARRIKVGRDPIEEIRLGNTDSRARVVVDFGDRPVPTFRIDRMNNGIVVMLGESIVQSAAGSAKPKLAAFQTVAQPLPVRAPGAGVPKSPAAGLSVNKAGVTDGLVVVELADGKNSKGKYRLVVDLDTKGMLVRNATLSDARGALKRFDLVERPSDSTAEASARSIRSAADEDDRDPGNLGPKPPGAAKYKWGLPSAQSRHTSAPDKRAGMPFQVEHFQLQAKKTDR